MDNKISVLVKAESLMFKCYRSNGENLTIPY